MLIFQSQSVKSLGQPTEPETQTELPIATYPHSVSNIYPPQLIENSWKISRNWPNAIADGYGELFSLKIDQLQLIRFYSIQLSIRGGVDSPTHPMA